MIVFYFSGTGNTKYIAELFANAMKCQVISIEKERKFDIESIIYQNEIITFCFPIYGSFPPKIIRDFVGKYKEGLNNKKLILLCSQAMASGDGARSILDELEGIKYEVIYASHFLMPNNICNIPFPVLAKKWYVKKAKSKIQKIANNLNMKKYKCTGFNPISILIGKSQRVIFKKVEKEYVNSLKINNSCNNCQKCINLCPINNLYFKDGKIKTKKQCMFCYRCINFCPQKAITVWIDKPVKKQYRGIKNINH